ncbi:MAG: beta-ketoacyl-[acyl-carrier-protein] synthase II [Gammaproteobacteria bacterium]|nr:MAG: beta-ketoacyl-[acyl-carrier-protein] synthase II [Gammaproteobacteria bacterium]
MSSERRVVVTGLGSVTPLGNDVETTWSNIINGESGAATITKFNPEEFTTTFAAELKGYDEISGLSSKEVRRVDPFVQYALTASDQAINDSNLSFENLDITRVGVSIGSGIGGLGSIEQNSLILKEKGPRKISPFFVPGAIINMASGNVAIKYNLQGPNTSIVSACSSAGHSIGYSARTISYGDADIMITGGSEAAITPLGLAGFNAAKALSTNNANPQEASCPWDKKRDGFLLGEGAGILILEEYEFALNRGAKIYGEVVGFGQSDDAFHITAPAEDGRGAFNAMINALSDFGEDLSFIDYINAHGTSTPLGDVIEAKAINDIFKDKNEKLSISSTKSMTGHLLGAAGAIEAIFCLLAMRDSIIPPTINLLEPDNEYNLDLTPNIAKKKDILYSMSNSFGFGGTNVSLIFKKI